MQRHLCLSGMQDHSILIWPDRVVTPTQVSSLSDGSSLTSYRRTSIVVSTTVVATQSLRLGRHPTLVAYRTEFVGGDPQKRSPGGALNTPWENSI